jgi:hypothetical protein
MGGGMTDDDSDDIDWRKILYAYVEHVATEEGVDYLPARLADHLTPKECSALHRLAADRRCTEGHRDRLLKFADELDEQ